MATYVMPPGTPGLPTFVQYTLTATAAALSGSSLLNSRTVVRKLTVKLASGAANNCYLGGSLVANTPTGAGIELAAGQSYTFENVGPGEVYIVGTVAASNIAFIVAEY